MQGCDNSFFVVILQINRALYANHERLVVCDGSIPFISLHSPPLDYCPSPCCSGFCSLWWGSRRRSPKLPLRQPRNRVVNVNLYKLESYANSLETVVCKSPSVFGYHDYSVLTVSAMSNLSLCSSWQCTRVVFPSFFQNFPFFLKYFPTFYLPPVYHLCCWC